MVSDCCAAKGGGLAECCFSGLYLSGVLSRTNTEACYLFINNSWRDSVRPPHSGGALARGGGWSPGAAENSFYGDAGRPPWRHRRVGEREELVEGEKREELVKER